MKESAVIKACKGLQHIELQAVSNEKGTNKTSIIVSGDIDIAEQLIDTRISAQTISTYPMIHDGRREGSPIADFVIYC